MTTTKSSKRTGRTQKHVHDCHNQPDPGDWFLNEQPLAAIIAAGIVFLAIQLMKPRSSVMFLNSKNNKEKSWPIR
jgi:hypothetical protein